MELNTIYIDMDGTFWDTVTDICELYAEDFCDHPDFILRVEREIDTWGFEELSLASYDYLNDYFSDARFFENIHPFPMAKAVCEVLSRNYRIVFVSIGTNVNLFGKRCWLKDNMHCPYEFIGVKIDDHDDKSHIDMSDGFFIDDSYDNLKTSNAAVNICFGKKVSWNEKWDGLRLKSWEDVYEYITNFDEETL